MEPLKFNDIIPRTRAERAAMRDKERIEICRLKERTGGYHKFVDSAQVHNPDPISTHYISEQERFDKDFAVADQKVRQQKFEQVQNNYAKQRDERLQRDIARFEKMESMDALIENTLKAKADHFNAGKKNKGGAAYNLLHLGYDATAEGQKLAQIDQDSHVRALMRAKQLNDRSNGQYDILTGQPRIQVQVPIHERYNPITHAGHQILGSQGSRRSVGPVPGM